MKMPSKDVRRENKPAADKPQKPDPLLARMGVLEQEVKALRAELKTYTEAHKNVPWNFEVQRDEKGISSFRAVPDA